jgi:hypothetical protein
MKLKKTALAMSLAAAGLLTAGTAQSYVIGPPGEALLVPFAMYRTNPGQELDTLIAIHTTSLIGEDAVPNQFTAPHVWAAGTQAGYGANNVANIYWNWYDEESNKILDGRIPVTPNQKLVISLRDLAATQGLPLNGQAGYFAFTTDAGRQGQDGDFLMMGDAVFLTGPTNPGVNTATSVPVLPMPDGMDGAPGDDDFLIPSNVNNCVSLPGPGPTAQQVDCSPITPGTRLSNGDADDLDQVVVDLELFPVRFAPQTLVVWQDRNYGVPGGWSVPYEIYDDDEGACSGTINVPSELNLVPLNNLGSPWPPGLVNTIWQGVDAASIADTCTPPSANRFGFLRLFSPEGFNSVDVPGPNSAAVYFTIASESTVFLPASIHTWLGHDVGKLDF